MNDAEKEYWAASEKARAALDKTRAAIEEVKAAQTALDTAYAKLDAAECERKKHIAALHTAARQLAQWKGMEAAGNMPQA